MTTKTDLGSTEIKAETAAEAEAATAEIPLEENPAYRFFKPLAELDFFDRGELLAIMTDMSKHMAALTAISEGRSDDAQFSEGEAMGALNRIARRVVEGFVSDVEAFRAWTRDQDYMAVLNFVLGYAGESGKSRSSEG